QAADPRARAWCLGCRRGRHMAIPEVDKSLTKGFAGKSRERQKREWPHKHWGIYGGPGWTGPTELAPDRGGVGGSSPPRPTINPPVFMRPFSLLPFSGLSRKAFCQRVVIFQYRHMPYPKLPQ